LAVATVVQGRLSVLATSDTKKPTESLNVRFPVVSDATTYDAPSLFAVTTPVSFTVTTVVLRDVNCRTPGLGMAAPEAVRTVTVSAAVVPAFMEKVLDPFGARTVSNAGALGSTVDDVDDPHAAHSANARFRSRERGARMALTYCAPRGGAAR
jgi:hypothetical protein